MVRQKSSGFKVQSLRFGSWNLSRSLGFRPLAGFWKAVFVICFLRFGISFAHSQDIHPRVTVDSTHYLIGDWINLTIEVKRPPNATIAWPQIADSLKPLEIIKYEQPTVKETENGILERVSLTLTAFDTGMFVIPNIKIPYTLDGKTTIAETSPILIFVQPVAVDTTRDIKDIKPPLSVPISLAEVLPYLTGIVGLGGLGWLVYYLLKKRRRGEGILPPPPPRPAHEVALEALRMLEAEKLWQRGKVKEYHSQLTNILRSYIENRLGILAMEMTTDEILASPPFDVERTSVRSTDNERTESSLYNIKETLQEILIRADLVKFAKFQPLPEENERSMVLAFSFVEATRYDSLPASENSRRQAMTPVLSEQRTNEVNA
jgi:hypothetical protein